MSTTVKTRCRRTVTGVALVAVFLAVGCSKRPQGPTIKDSAATETVSKPPRKTVSKRATASEERPSLEQHAAAGELGKAADLVAMQGALVGLVTLPLAAFGGLETFQASMELAGAEANDPSAAEEEQKPARDGSE